MVVSDLSAFHTVNNLLTHRLANLKLPFYFSLLSMVLYCTAWHCCSGGKKLFQLVWINNMTFRLKCCGRFRAISGGVTTLFNENTFNCHNHHTRCCGRDDITSVFSSIIFTKRTKKKILFNAKMPVTQRSLISAAHRHPASYWGAGLNVMNSQK